MVTWCPTMAVVEGILTWLSATHGGPLAELGINRRLAPLLNGDARPKPLP